MSSEPREEHRWLQQLVGEWTFEGEAVTTPGGEPERTSGVERVRPLGGEWVVHEARESHASSDAFTTLMALGFDPARGRFVGSFVAPGMPNLWVYDGALDADRRTLTLDTEGPSFTGEPGLAPYRDTIELVSADERVLRSATPGADGVWRTFMTTRYRRVG